jgi:hypothetical protein
MEVLLHGNIKLFLELEHAMHDLHHAHHVEIIFNLFFLLIIQATYAGPWDFF